MNRSILRPLKTLATDRRGSVAVEGAFVIIFLMILLVGLVSVGDMIDVKERLSRIANQSAQVISGMASSDTANTEIPTILQRAATMAAANGISISARACNGWNGTWSFTSQGNRNECGMGRTNGSVAAETAACTAATAGRQYVVVVATCGFRPLIPVTFLSGNNAIRLHSDSFAVMKNYMR